MAQRTSLPAPARRAGRTGSVSPRGIAAVCAPMALAATAGAVGLAGGGIDLGPTITARLPWHSPVVAGVALGVVVALPMAVAAVTGWRRSLHTAEASILAGLTLIGWIVVEIAVIRTFSWLQPACLAYGAVVLALGLLLRHPQPRAGARP